MDSPWFCVLIEKSWPLFDTLDSAVVHRSFGERVDGGKGGDVDVKSSLLSSFEVTSFCSEFKRSVELRGRTFPRGREHSEYISEGATGAPFMLSKDSPWYILVDVCGVSFMKGNCSLSADDCLGVTSANGSLALLNGLEKLNAGRDMRFAPDMSEHTDGDLG